MIEIRQAEKIKALEFILHDQCNHFKMSEEATKARMDHFEKELEKDDVVCFVALDENLPVGYMLNNVREEHVETMWLYASQSEKMDEVLIELIQEGYRTFKDMNKQFFQIFFIMNLDIRSKLEELGYSVYPRARMLYSTKENSVPAYQLHEDYQAGVFTWEKLDEILSVAVGANLNSLDGKIFTQFTDLDKLKHFMFTDPDIKEKLNAQSPIVLKDGKIVGINIIKDLSETATYIWDLAVLPEHRGKGLGKYLMQKSHEIGHQLGFEQIILDVTIDNTIAYNIYKKAGYKETLRYLTAVINF